jgi:hypothetical protein
VRRGKVGAIDKSIFEIDDFCSRRSIIEIFEKLIEENQFDEPDRAGLAELLRKLSTIWNWNAFPFAL